MDIILIIKNTIRNDRLFKVDWFITLYIILVSESTLWVIKKYKIVIIVLSINHIILLIIIENKWRDSVNFDDVIWTYIIINNIKIILIDFIIPYEVLHILLIILNPSIYPVNAMNSMSMVNRCDKNIINPKRILKIMRYPAQICSTVIGGWKISDKIPLLSLVTVL